MAWEQWFQDVAGTVINKAADAKFTQPYEIDRLRLQALGELGVYNEGQAVKSTPGQAGGLFGLSQGATLLLIGGLFAAVVMLKD